MAKRLRRILCVEPPETAAPFRAAASLSPAELGALEGWPSAAARARSLATIGRLRRLIRERREGWEASDGIQSEPAASRS